jgi:hypothetical protein
VVDLHCRDANKPMDCLMFLSKIPI